MASKTALSVCCLMLYVFGAVDVSGISHTEAGYKQKMKSMFTDGFTYGGHSYFLSRDIFESRALTQVICNLFDGYVVVINDEAEYEAVTRFISDASATIGSSNDIFIDGTDRDHEGRWTLYTGEPVPVLKWSADRPRGHGNCMKLYQANCLMSDTECYQPDPYQWGFRFMCEISDSNPYNIVFG